MLTAGGPERSGANGTTVQPASTLRRVAWLIFALLLCVYLLTAKGFTEILDAECYYLITRGLVERGDVSLQPELGLGVLRGDEPVRHGKRYALFGIGYPLLLVPFYVAGRAGQELAVSLAPRVAKLAVLFPRVAVSLALVLITAATGVVVYYLTLHMGYGPGTAAAGALIFGLATYAWPYAKIGFYEPFLGLCQGLALLWAGVYARGAGVGWLVAAGFALGWGIAAKPSLALALPVIAAYVAWNALRGDTGARGIRLARACLALALGLLPWCIVVGSYNALRTGSVFSDGHSAADTLPSGGLAQFGLSLLAHLVSPGRGFVIFSPILAAAVIGVPVLWRRSRAEVAAILAITALTVCYHASVPRRLHDYAWGPRMLEPLAPLLTVVAVAGMAAVWPRPGARRALQGLLAVSVGVQLLAVAMSFAPWMDHVWAQSSDWRVQTFALRYAPLWGQVQLLSRMTLAPMDRAAEQVAGGFLSEAFKAELRSTPDFWWAYAYRLGIPGPLILSAMVLLAAGAGWSARGLWRATRAVPSALPPESPPGGDDR